MRMSLCDKTKTPTPKLIVIDHQNTLLSIFNLNPITSYFHVNYNTDTDSQLLGLRGKGIWAI